MTTTQRIRALGLSIETFAAQTGYHPTTIYSWGKPRSQRGIQCTPAVVLRLLEAWERSGAPPLPETNSTAPQPR